MGRGERIGLLGSSQHPTSRLPQRPQGFSCQAQLDFCQQLFGLAAVDTVYQPRQELCCNQAVMSSLGQPAGAPARPLTRENLWPVLQGSLLSVSSNLKSCSSSRNRPLKAVPTSSPRLLPVRSVDC